MFGTFQPEEERPTYGLTKNINSFNPVTVALKTWEELFKAVRHSGSLKNAISYFMQPPGWSPDGSTKTVRQMRSAGQSLSGQDDRIDQETSKMPHN